MRVDPHKHGESVLLAVSGGIDSMVMAHLMLHFSHASGDAGAVRLAVAHCNFHLRGEESDADERLVREWAEKNGLECHIAQFDTREYAERNAVSIEMAARELRYSYFDELCRKHAFAGVCVAHNADDNAETLLLNLVRGTGLPGACAMRESSRNPYGESMVYRPLLGYSRAEIVDYASKWGVEFREDSTNAQTDARRNVIRNLVFPVLKDLNPSLIRTLNADIEHFRQARDIVEASVKGLPSVLKKEERTPRGKLESREYVDVEALVREPFWQYRLHETLSSLGFSSPVAGEIETMLERGGTKGGKRFEGRDYTAITSGGRLIFERRNPGNVHAGHAGISMELMDWTSDMNPRTERGVILMDAGHFDGEPVLRSWRDGDYLIPIGMKGKKKVSDLLTDLKYDIVSKKSVMVVEGCGNHVLAVVGERIDKSVAVSPSTTRVYRISIE